MSENNALKANLEGKAAIVTGGTRGIGYAVAERLLSEGMRVGICGTHQSSVDGAVKRLSAKGTVQGMVADVSKADRVKEFVAGIHKAFGRIDVLVNNAGAGTFRPVAEMSPDQWDRMISLNLSGAYYCCHEVLPIFREQGAGYVVNISSLAGKNPFAGGAGYNASKFGLNGFSEALMLDHRYDGVRVTSVMPGSVATEFGGGSAGAGADWKIAPEDIADVIVMLLRMPARTTVSAVEIRPSRPPRK